MADNIFKHLTDEMYALYQSCKESGFGPGQAFELTKTYCSVAFVNQSIRLADKSRNDRSAILRRYRENINKMKIEEENKE